MDMLSRSEQRCLNQKQQEHQTSCRILTENFSKSSGIIHTWKMNLTLEEGKKIQDIFSKAVILP